MRWHPVSLVLLAGLLGSPPPAGLAQPPAKDPAKGAAEQFLQAAKDKDLDGLMKVADVPWFSDGERVIKDRDELKKDLKANWIDLANPERLPSEVLRATSYGEARGLLKGEKRRLADEVLAKDDVVLFVGRGGKEKGMLVVRVREGKGKVVGAAE